MQFFAAVGTHGEHINLAIMKALGRSLHWNNPDIAVRESSNPPWVNIGSAGWVNIQSALTA